MVWAYVGDAVFELYVREHLVQRGLASVDSLHRQAVGLVRASSQAARIRAVEPILSPEEQEVVHRGRNAHGSGVARSASAADYRMSTGLEALLGFLYLTGRSERLQEILAALLPELAPQRAPQGGSQA